MKQIKDILIILTFVGVVSTFGKLIIDSNAGKRQVQEFNFPSEIPLKGWKKLKTTAGEITNPETDKPYEQIIAMHTYDYEKDGKFLEVKMSYVVGTLGKAKAERPLEQQYTRSLTAEEISPEWTKKEGLQYAIFTHEGRSHLVACINPRGGSSVTSQQFRANRREYDLTLGRFFTWLKGKESLLDRRCLWNNLSLSVVNSSSEDVNPILEEAWFSWYQWWSDNFPNH